MSSQVKASILIGFPSFQTSTEVLQGKAGNFQLILYGTEELESEGGGGGGGGEPTPEASVELRMRQ